MAACAILGTACSAARSRVGPGGWDAAPRGWDAAPREVSVPAGRREEGAWGHTSGLLPSHPRGCKADGPPQSRCKTWCIAPSRQCQPQKPLPAWPLHPHGSGGLLASQKKVDLPGAHGHHPRGHLTLDNWHSQVMRDQGEVSPGDWGGHNWDAASSSLLLAHN